MEHSIAAKYAARPAARFPRTAARDRQRRLGLRAAIVFRAAPARVTVLRRPDRGSLGGLRSGARATSTVGPRMPSSGRIRPVVSMSWSRSVPVHRPSAPVAPWRA